MFYIHFNVLLTDDNACVSHTLHALTQWWLGGSLWLSQPCQTGSI